MAGRPITVTAVVQSVAAEQLEWVQILCVWLVGRFDVESLADLETAFASLNCRVSQSGPPAGFDVRVAGVRGGRFDARAG
jgi:hypothetical protein